MGINAKEIGEKLKNLRGEKSTYQVAGDLGISPSAVSMYENGERIPRDGVKIKIANYYGIGIGELFFGEKSN